MVALLATFHLSVPVEHICRAVEEWYNKLDYLLHLKDLMEAVKQP